MSKILVFPKDFDAEKLNIVRDPQASCQKTIDSKAGGKMLNLSYWDETEKNYKKLQLHTPVGILIVGNKEGNGVWEYQNEGETFPKKTILFNLSEQEEFQETLRKIDNACKSFLLGQGSTLYPRKPQDKLEMHVMANHKPLLLEDEKYGASYRAKIITQKATGKNFVHVFKGDSENTEETSLDSLKGGHIVTAIVDVFQMYMMPSMFGITTFVDQIKYYDDEKHSVQTKVFFDIKDGTKIKRKADVALEEDGEEELDHQAIQKIQKLNDDNVILADDDFDGN